MIAYLVASAAFIALSTLATAQQVAECKEARIVGSIKSVEQGESLSNVGRCGYRSSLRAAAMWKS